MHIFPGAWGNLGGNMQARVVIIPRKHLRAPVLVFSKTFFDIFIFDGRLFDIWHVWQADFTLRILTVNLGRLSGDPSVAEAWTTLEYHWLWRLSLSLQLEMCPDRPQSSGKFMTKHSPNSSCCWKHFCSWMCQKFWVLAYDYVPDKKKSGFNFYLRRSQAGQ